jgi:hypothetical protein
VQKATWSAGRINLGGGAAVNAVAKSAELISLMQRLCTIVSSLQVTAVTSGSPTSLSGPPDPLARSPSRRHLGPAPNHRLQKGLRRLMSTADVTDYGTDWAGATSAGVVLRARQRPPERRQRPRPALPDDDRALAPYHPAYGLDLRMWVGRAMSPADVSALQLAVKAQAEDDVRVDHADVRGQPLAGQLDPGGRHVH